MLTLACCLWLRSQLYCSDAETENGCQNLPKWVKQQWYQRWSSQRPHTRCRSHCLPLSWQPKAAFSHLWWPKLLECSVLVRSCRWWTPCRRLVHRPGASNCKRTLHRKTTVWLCNNWHIFWWNTCWQIAIKTINPPKFPAIQYNIIGFQTVFPVLTLTQITLDTDSVNLWIPSHSKLVFKLSKSLDIHSVNLWIPTHLSPTSVTRWHPERLRCLRWGAAKGALHRCWRVDLLWVFYRCGRGKGAQYVSVMQHSSTLDQSHPLQLVCEHTGTEGARLAK